MLEYLYPTSYKKNKQWDVMTAQDWVDSKKRFLTFAFKRFFPHTLSHDPFWLYLYYTKSRSEDSLFRGKLRYRFQVVDWSPEPFLRPDTFYRPSTEEARIWFLCDAFNEVRCFSGEMLAFEDFQHAQGKNLASCLRCSIAPVICKTEIKVIEQYP